MNQLEFNSKQRTLYSISILNSPSFRKGRRKTKEGRQLYNKELRLARKKVKQYNINLNKKLPKLMKGGQR